MPRTSQISLAPKISMPKPTRAEEVRRRLAAEIAAGILAPGTHLDEIEQSARLGVSRTPLREALRELAALGLVCGTAHRGVAVAEGISPHMADALASLEGLFGSHAAIHMSGRQRGELRRLAVERGDWLAMIHAHAGNPVLVRYAEILWQPLLATLASAPFAADRLHPLELGLADAVAGGRGAEIAAAARSYVEACVGAVFSMLKG